MLQHTFQLINSTLLETQKTLLGDEDVLTLKTLNNLALCLEHQGNNAQVRKSKQII